MTVEFLDSHDDAEGRDDGAADAPLEDRGPRSARLADVVLSLAGAALFVVASFRSVYSVSGLEEGFNYRATALGAVHGSRR